VPWWCPALVVLPQGHGLGSQKDMGLHPYAEQFAQVSLAWPAVVAAAGWL